MIPEQLNDMKLKEGDFKKKVSQQSTRRSEPPLLAAQVEKKSEH